MHETLGWAGRRTDRGTTWHTPPFMEVRDLPTPALVIERAALDANIATMAAAHPGARLRPHVKAHKCTSLAARQHAAGHTTFTCATPREAVGMAAAGFGDDLLIANEVVDPRRLDALAALADEARITIAVDSEATIAAAALAGLRSCLVDVDVGLPRCGCDPADAGRLADLARAKGLEVRGVMGYEGHLMALEDRAKQREQVEAAMAVLVRAHGDVGGEIISAGGTGTYDLQDTTGVTEVQAGSYALMDTAYAKLAPAVRPGAVRRRHGHRGAARPRRRRRRPQGARHGPRQPVDRRRQRVVLQRRARHVRTPRRPPGRRRSGARGPGPRRPDDGDARGRLAGRR